MAKIDSCPIFKFLPRLPLSVISAMRAFKKFTPEISDVAFTPEFLVFPITYRCNLHCKMCFCPDQAKEMGELDLAGVDKCLASITFASGGHIGHVNLTGGEPFLRNDITEVVRCLSRCGVEKVGISANGLDTERTLGAFKTLLDAFPGISWAIQLSIDGPEEVHNRVRGDKKAFASVIATLERLLALKDGYCFDLSSNMTISRENIGSVKEFDCWFQERFSGEVATGYTFSVNSDLYIDSRDSEVRGQFEDEKYIEAVRDTALWLYREKGDLFALDVHLMTKGYERFTPCAFRSTGYFLEPSGKVYKCSLFTESFVCDALDGITLDEDVSGKALERVSDECSKCLNNCGNARVATGYGDFLRSQFVKTRERVFLASAPWDIFTPAALRRMALDFVGYKGQPLADNDLLLAVRGSRYEDLVTANREDCRYHAIPIGAQK